MQAVVPGWLRRYRREWLLADGIAGLIIWSVVTPQCVAYAQIAGLPPAAGLLRLGGVADLVSKPVMTGSCSAWG